MKAILIIILSLLYSVDFLYCADPYKQPLDNSVREIVVTKVYDGDTVTATILFGSLGREQIKTENIRLRLKGVNCYEMNAKDQKDRDTAVMERDVLFGLLQTSGIITAHLYHQTYDRFEAVLYTKKGNVNDAMKTYPQNKSIIRKVFGVFHKNK